MQCVNVTKLTLEQLKRLWHLLPNYTVINCNSLREQFQQIDENYPDSMPTQLIILIMVLVILIRIIGIVIFIYCKYRCISNQSKTSGIFWHRNNQK